MRALEYVLKVLMSIGMIAWTICAFAIAFNGVASGESLDGILNTLLIFTFVTGVFEGVLGVGVLILEEIGR